MFLTRGGASRRPLLTASHWDFTAEGAVRSRRGKLFSIRPCRDGPSQYFRESNALLDKAARDYVNHPRGAALAAGKLTVSSIYVWYAADFGGTERGVIEHLKHHARPELTAALAGIERISGDRYDWTLNDLRE
jgi:hypothetical protein